MKIHTSVITKTDIFNAASAKGMTGVYVESIKVSGSRSRDRAFDVYLTGNSSYAPNGRGLEGDKAAQWDEWGIFIEFLFSVDPNAIIGQYRSWDDFRFFTGNRFDTLIAAQTHKRHKWENAGDFRSECDCGATTNWSRAYAAKA